MQRSQAAAIVITILLLAAIGWRLHGTSATSPTPEPVAPTITASRPAAGTPTPTAAEVAQRLAGVALGNTRYAVVEQPDGTTALYRAGDDVPGLGRIVDVTEDSATFEGTGGRVRLQVKPPPSPTPAPSATPRARATAAQSTWSPGPDRSAPESPPSGAPGRPAS